MGRTVTGNDPEFPVLRQEGTEVIGKTRAAVDACWQTIDTIYATLAGRSDAVMRSSPIVASSVALASVRETLEAHDFGSSLEALAEPVDRLTGAICTIFGELDRSDAALTQANDDAHKFHLRLKEYGSTRVHAAWRQLAAGKLTGPSDLLTRCTDLAQLDQAVRIKGLAAIGRVRRRLAEMRADLVVWSSEMLTLAADVIARSVNEQRKQLLHAEGFAKLEASVMSRGANASNAQLSVPIERLLSDAKNVIELVQRGIRSADSELPRVHAMTNQIDACAPLLRAQLDTGQSIQNFRASCWKLHEAIEAAREALREVRQRLTDVAQALYVARAEAARALALHWHTEAARKLLQATKEYTWLTTGGVYAVLCLIGFVEIALLAFRFAPVVASLSMEDYLLLGFGAIVPGLAVLAALTAVRMHFERRIRRPVIGHVFTKAQLSQIARQPELAIRAPTDPIYARRGAYFLALGASVLALLTVLWPLLKPEWDQAVRYPVRLYLKDGRVSENMMPLLNTADFETYYVFGDTRSVVRFPRDDIQCVSSTTAQSASTDAACRTRPSSNPMALVASGMSKLANAWRSQLVNARRSYRRGEQMDPLLAFGLGVMVADHDGVPSPGFAWSVLSCVGKNRNHVADICFANGSFTLDAAERRKFEELELGSMLSKAAESSGEEKQLVLVGFASERGRAASNLDLAGERLNTVRALVQKETQHDPGSLPLGEEWSAFLPMSSGECPSIPGANGSTLRDDNPNARRVAIYLCKAPWKPTVTAASQAHHFAVATAPASNSVIERLPEP
jgi:hypothetical protein